MDKFKLVSKFKPMGDQPEAIDKLVNGFQRGKKEQLYWELRAQVKLLPWQT